MNFIPLTMKYVTVVLQDGTDCAAVILDDHNNEILNTFGSETTVLSKLQSATYVTDYVLGAGVLKPKCMAEGKVRYLTDGTGNKLVNLLSKANWEGESLLSQARVIARTYNSRVLIEQKPKAPEPVTPTGTFNKFKNLLSQMFLGIPYANH